MLVDRVLGGLPAAERGGDLVGDLGQALGAQVEHELEVALGRAHVAGDVERLRALDVVLGGQAQLVDLDLQLRRVARAVGHALEERLAHRLVGVVDDRRDVAVVVLQRVVLAAVEAALEAEDDEDGEDRERAEADRLAQAGGLAIRWGSRTTAACGGGRTARPRGARSHSCGLVTLVEERQQLLPVGLGKRPVCPSDRTFRGTHEVVQSVEGGSRGGERARRGRGRAEQRGWFAQRRAGARRTTSCTARRQAGDGEARTW